MNKFFGLGRITADPELQQIQSENKSVDLLKFSIAVNEYRVVNDEKIKYTHFFDCEAWDSGARVLAEQVKKGDLLCIEGKLRQNRWETAEGSKRSKVIVRVENFTIAQRVNRDDVKSNDNGNNNSGGDEPAPF